MPKLNPFNPIQPDRNNPFNPISNTGLVDTPPAQRPIPQIQPEVKNSMVVKPTAATYGLPESTISQGKPDGVKPSVEPSIWNKIARTVLPKAAEDYFGLNPQEGKPLTVQESEDAKQSYWRGQRKEQNIADVKMPVAEYTPPATFGGKLKEVFENKGYIGNVWTGFIKPAIGTVGELSGIQLDNPKVREWGEQFTDKVLEKESRRASAQSMADVPGTFEGGLKDPRYYSKTMTQAIGFMSAMLGTSILTTAVTKNPVVGAIAGFGVGAAIESSGAYQGMIEDGVAPDDANTAAQIYGVLAPAIENATGIKPAGGLKALTTDFAVDAAKHGGVKSFFKKWAEEGILEEGSQQLVENLVVKFVDKDRKAFENIMESMVGGAVGALPLVGGGAVISNYKQKKTKDITKEDIAGPDGKPLVITHFTGSENIDSILTEGFDTSKSPLHGIGGKEAGEKTGKFGEDILYFTTDTGRWNQATVYVGAGKGNVDGKSFDYDKQEWVLDPFAYKIVDLAPIESTIKDEAKILTVDSLKEAQSNIEGFNIGSFDKHSMMDDLIKAAKKGKYDILNVVEGEANNWVDPDSDPTKTGYAVLTGNSGNSDFFVLNKDILKIKGAKQATPELPMDKPIGELDATYKATGPGYKKLETFIDKMVTSETVTPEDASILKTLFENTNDDFLNMVNFKENGRLTRTFGRFSVRTSGITGIMPSSNKLEMQRGLSTKTQRPPSLTFTHEYGHAGWYLVLSEQERAEVTEIYNGMSKSQQRALFSEHDRNHKYYAKDVEEFFAQSFADYIFENKIPVQQMESLLKRIAKRFFDGLRTLINRKNQPAVEAMRPLYEKILAGDNSTPLTEFAEMEPPSFKENLQEMLSEFDTEEETPLPAEREKPPVYEPKPGLGPLGEPVAPKKPKPLFPEGRKAIPKAQPALSPFDESLFGTEPPMGMSPAEMAENARQTAVASLPPDIGSTIEPIQRVTQLEKRTPVNERVSFWDKWRTPWRVMKKLGAAKEYRKMIGAYESYLKELPKNIDKIRDWMKQVPDESNQKIFQSLDGKNVQLNPEEARVAGEIRAWLAEWADRLGMEKDERLSDYITHIFPPGTKGEIPEEIATIIKDKTAKSIYDPFLLHRKGAEGYIENTWLALDAYVKRATRKANIDPYLQEFNEATAHLTEESQVEYIEKRVSTLNMRPTRMEKDLDNALARLFPNLAPRFTLRTASKARKILSRAKIAGSMTSLGKNLTQGINTWSELGTRYTNRGYRDLAKFGGKELEENSVLRDSFHQDITYSAVKAYAEKFDKVLFANMNATELINRGSAYYGAKAKFLAGKITPKEYRLAFDKKQPEGYTPTLEDAIEYGKFVAEKTQFLFGPLETPHYVSGPMAKLGVQFQTFGMKQAEYIGQMLGDKEFAKFTRYMIGSSLLFHYIAGAVGMSWDDSFKTFRWGMPPILQFFVDLWQRGALGEDQYGNKLDAGERAGAVGKSLFTNVVPMGAQLNKTYEGFKAVDEGAVRDKSGKLKYKVDQTPMNYVRGTLFGKYNLQESKDYYKEKDDKARGKTKKSSGSNPFNPI